MVLEGLELDGALLITAPPGTTVVVREGVRVKNKGWAMEPVKADDPDEVRQQALSQQQLGKC